MVRYQVLVLEPFLIKDNHDGRLEIFGLDDNLGAWHAWIIPNNGWSDQKLIEDFA